MSNCRKIEISMLWIPRPSAWNTEERTMVMPPKRKLQLRVRKAGMPMPSISSEAWKIPRSRSGMNWNRITATIMMQRAYVMASRIVWMIRSGFLAP